MLKMDAGIVIPTLVEANLERRTHFFKREGNQTTHPGILIGLNISGYRHVGGNSFSEHRQIYILFYGNVHVWVATIPKGEHWSPMAVPMEYFKHTSTYNSCWKSDGLYPLNSLHLDVADTVIRESGSSHVVPADIDVSASFLSSFKPLDKVTVTHEYLEGNKFSSNLDKFKLVSIRE
jgi:hypothetical protein